MTHDDVIALIAGITGFITGVGGLIFTWWKSRQTAKLKKQELKVEEKGQAIKLSEVSVEWVEQFQRRMEALEKKSELQDQQLLDQNCQIKLQDQKIHDQSLEIKRLRDQLKSKDERIAELEKKTAVQDKEIIELRQSNQVKDDVIADLTKRLEVVENREAA